MTRWHQEKKHEHYYRQAKKSGYRARSAYKLKQINKKYKIISQGDCVLDLGATPGGWSQVASELVGSEGCVITVDREPMLPLDHVFTIQGDIAQKATHQAIDDLLTGSSIDVVLSDMSPDISGNYTIDQACSVYLCEQALEICNRFLKPQGHFVCKLFEGEDTAEFYKKLQNQFARVYRFSPPASRKSSSELYCIALGFTDKN